MSIKTIECRLYTSPDTLRYLWELMAQQNTPLINDLLHQISQHSDFETWLKTKTMPQEPIKELCKQLKTQYHGQPGRFYSSAIALTHYIYKSWLAIQKQLQQRIEGKQRWLNILKSDLELEQISGHSLTQIIEQAEQILQTITPEQLETKKTKFDLINHFLQEYEEKTAILERCAIAYLLKNQFQILEEYEDQAKFEQYRKTKEIQIQRLQTQLESRLPKGRDLTGEQWLETLAIATQTMPEDEQKAATWQSNLLKKSPVIPYPIAYETNTDLTWLKDERGHLQVKFNGLGKHKFEIRCDRRHLHWFQRFYEDQQIQKQGKDQHSSALFTLRSARLLWRENEGNGAPWLLHTLYLQCTLDTRFWSAEGTNQIAEEKAVSVEKTLDRLKNKETLNQNQQAYQKRQQSILDKIITPFPRPHKTLYEGDSAILVGVSFGLQKPATVAVVNGMTGQAIAYRSIKQLLGENYPLLNRQQKQKQELSQKRHQQQKQEGFNQFGESNLGEYLDRLIAKAIVEIAQNYHAGSIVLPELKQIREILHSEVLAKAQTKIKGYQQGQKQYAKQYLVNLHQWSYGRLIEYIKQKASQLGITIETAKQADHHSPQEKAKNLALCAYQSRLEKCHAIAI